MSVRISVLPIMLSVLMLHSAQSWAGAWQQAASARVSTEFDTNPLLSPSQPAKLWRTIFEPGYILKRVGNTNDLNAGLALQMVRTSNQTLSQNREIPSAFINWQKLSETGGFGLSARYDEAETRITELDSTGLIYTDSTRASRAMSGNWSEALTERSNLTLNAAYNDISYNAGPFFDYVTRSSDMKFSYAWSESITPFIRMSYSDSEQAGSNTLNRHTSALLGWNWKVADYLEGSVQAGKSKTSGTSTGKQGAVEVKYTGQRYGITLNADRKVIPSGLGGFVTIDQAQGGWNYALAERGSAGIDLGWSKHYSDIGLISLTAGSWVQYQLYTNWVARAHYQHKKVERGGFDAATANVLGLSLVFSRTDF